MTNTELLIKISEFKNNRYIIEIDNKKYDMVKVATITSVEGRGLSLADFYYRCTPVEEGE